MRCWYTRWQMSNALERDDLALASYLARGHAARCAACGSFGHALVALDARLARDAHLATVPVVARRARWPLWLAPIAVGAVAAVALTVRTGEQPDASAGEPAPSGFQVADAMVRVRGVADQVSQALARTPLETELDALVHDGKRGLDAVLDASGLR